MADGFVTRIQPHDQVLLIIIQKRSLDDTSTHALVEEVLTAAAERPGVPVVLDMGRVKFAPSVALGSLVRLSKSFKLDQRRIALIGVDPRVREAIHVTQLHRILEIHDTINQIVNAPPPSHGGASLDSPAGLQ